MADDFTSGYRFQRILVEAAEYRMLRQIYESDPQIKPKTAHLLRDCFAAARRDDPGTLHRIAGNEDD
jgi:hypothetical protein